MDHELTALHRATRAHPGDLAAGLAYANALARAGERAAHYAELARLARLGSEEAQHTLAGWNPQPFGHSERAPPRKIARVTTRTHATPRTCLCVAGTARDDVALVTVHRDEGSGILAIDARSLEERWRAPARQALVVGDDVIVAHGTELLRLDARDGRLRARRALNGNANHIDGAGDRVVVSLEHDASLHVFASSLEPVELFPRDEALRSFAVSAQHVFATHDGRVLALALEDGARLWETPPGDARLILAADAHGAISSHAPLAAPGRASPPERLEARDAAGTLLWSRTGVELPVLGENVVALVRRRSHLDLVDRATGATRWTRELRSIQRCALVPGAALVAWLPDDDHLQLAAVGLEDGAPLWTQDIGGGLALAVSLVPLDGAVLAFADRPKQLAVSRLDAT